MRKLLLYLMLLPWVVGTAFCDEDPIYKALKAGFVGGKIADTASTIYVLENGGIERNPILRPIAGNYPIFIAVQIGMTCGRRISSTSTNQN